MSFLYDQMAYIAQTVAKYRGPEDYVEIAGQFGDYLETLQARSKPTLGECRSLWRMVDPDLRTALCPRGGADAPAVETSCSVGTAS